jgi:hypothetical protein
MRKIMWTACFIGSALALTMCRERVPDMRETVKLKIQDSTGYVERVIPVDSLGGNLAAFVRALREAEDPESALLDRSEEDTLFSGEGWRMCGCESPLDSIELMLKDGKKRKFRVYCSDVDRVEGASHKEIRFTEINKAMLSNRWDNVRSAFCPKGYGCDDGSHLDYWYNASQVLTDSGWEENYDGNVPSLAYGFAALLKKKNASDPIIEAVYTVTAKDSIVTGIHIDSVAAGYRDWAEEFAHETVGTKVRDLDYERNTFKVTAYNFSKQK